MQLQFAVLADTAQIMSDGKFIIVGGGIDYINAPSFPAMNPSLALVVRLTVSPQDVGHEHQFRVELLLPDGTNILPTQGSTAFTPQASGSSGIVTPQSYMFVVNLPGIVFPREGRYLFRLFIDNRKVSDVPLHLQTLPPTQTSV